MVTDASLLYIVIGVFSFIIGALGNKRNIGSIYAFLLSVTLTPFVGLVITLCTNKYSVKLPKKSKAIKVTGIVLMMVGMIIAITATMILKESSENYEYYDKGPMYTLINFGTGIFLLGLFNFENGRGKTFAKIPENEEDQGELRVFTITGQTEPLNPVEKENILIETTILENKARNKINLGQTRISIALLLALVFLGTYIYHKTRTFDIPVIQESRALDVSTIKVKNGFAHQYLDQMLNNETQTFRATGHLKAFNGNWQFKIPNSFAIYEGSQPHVLIKIGHPSNLYMAMAVSGHNLNHDFNDYDIIEFFRNGSLIDDIISEKGVSIQEKIITIDGMPGYMAEAENRFTHNDKEIKIRGLSFFFVSNKCLFNLTCTVASDDLNENLSQKMNEYRNFFELVVGSIVLN